MYSCYFYYYHVLLHLRVKALPCVLSPTNACACQHYYGEEFFILIEALAE